jgi:hypothetical protein
MCLWLCIGTIQLAGETLAGQAHTSNTSLGESTDLCNKKANQLMILYCISRDPSWSCVLAPLFYFLFA